MPTLRKDLQASTLSDFVEFFAPGGELSAPVPQWYRGDPVLRRRRALLPSIARSPSRISEEWQIYQRFRQSAAAFLPHMRLDRWDWLLYMRHFGKRTRLLDWTESPIVALYFAVDERRHDRSDGVVWCLDPLRLNELANYGRQIQCAGVDTELDGYTVESLRSAPKDADFKPVAFIAPRSFPRLVAQQGVFTVTHKKQISLDSIGDPQLLARVRIPRASKDVIRKSLASIGVNRLSLYPEMQSLAEVG